MGKEEGESLGHNFITKVNNYTFALFILGIVLLLFKSAQEIGVI
jgi:hypothetical protein